MSFRQGASSIQIDQFNTRDDLEFAGDMTRKVLKTADKIGMNYMMNGISYEVHHIDYILPQLSKFNSIKIILMGHTEPDFAKLEVLAPIPPTNEYGNPDTGTIGKGKSFTKKWCFDHELKSQDTPVLPYSAALPALIMIRTVYYKAGLSDVIFKANYSLHAIKVIE